MLNTILIDHERIEKIIRNIRVCQSKNELDSLKSQLNGMLNDLTKMIKNIDSANRSSVGKFINEIKSKAQSAIDEKANEFDISIDFVANDKYSLPVSQISIGKLHPLTAAMIKLHNIFDQMGFQHIYTNEIENEYCNFTGLNISADHPARSASDTFYIQDDVLLRTHTSNAQIHVLKELSKNIEAKLRAYVLNQEIFFNFSSVDAVRIISSGRVYRSDQDSTHTPMFHQIEGFVVGKDITLANLKWCLLRFCREFFESNDVKIRMRSSYFPFTEPSIEIDIGCRRVNNKLVVVSKDDEDECDWIEILGSGMIHPSVFRNCGIDSSKFTGFAFGIGVERMTMLIKDIPTLSNFYGRIDIRWLNKYGSLPF
ncbi:phenylalanine--tRNA ligase subunit alpha [Candidatus Gromoviella agglomerans]|uniref:phenylalanine--tRNA ligase subunit alpha n=1 Tax=Candidatus Gromoviella agglomerans TaxID=2806609 RepID=UPI001E563AA4|nr:phenylalanine--tRNA ligase subunit alpha [Candidatus Gromoviella agglomerans]UFX98487.1 Phenylalanine--tRNA ligase alpha subunit [Candidatus Gromoviella agglomerans]